MTNHTDAVQPSARGPRRVLIVDDHRSYAEAIALAIDLQDDLECVAIADSAAAATDAALRHAPDVALIDMRLPDGTGPELARRLRRDHVGLSVLAITAFADTAAIAAAADAGASAFLRKECSVWDIVERLRTARDGDMAIDAATLRMVLHGSQPTGGPALGEVPTPTSDAPALTPREAEVLSLVAQADDAQAIARRLGLSIHTVRGYLKALKTKLDVHSQLELVVRATELGLVGRAAPAIVVDLTGSAPAILTRDGLSYAS